MDSAAAEAAAGSHPMLPVQPLPRPTATFPHLQQSRHVCHRLLERRVCGPHTWVHRAMQRWSEDRTVRKVCMFTCVVVCLCVQVHRFQCGTAAYAPAGSGFESAATVRGRL